MQDIFAQFIQILVSIAFGIAVSCRLGLYRYRGLEWAIAIICILSYLIIRCVLPLRLFTGGLPGSTTTIMLSNSNADDNSNAKANSNVKGSGSLDEIKIPGVDVERGVLPGDKFAKYGTTKYPVMGPLDNLNVDEASSRLKYLASTVSTPYSPMSYYNWRTDADKRRNVDSSALVDANNVDDYKNKVSGEYPNMTNGLTNARDCTSYEPGHPFSCIQEWPEGNRLSSQEIGSILDKETRDKLDKFTDMDEEPLRKMVADEYRRMKPDSGGMWRNAPGEVARGSTHHSWHDLCRNCKVGKCVGGICGSRLIEPGNNNIIDSEKLLRDYMSAN